MSDAESVKRKPPLRVEYLAHAGTIRTRMDAGSHKFGIYATIAAAVIVALFCGVLAYG